MQYVRSVSSSVTKTWNSINPATLSGAIDVIVVEQQDGSLACSPFHVRFGKFSLLRPSEKKVEFTVNDVKQDFAMKLGDGGEAFFVFETSDDIPEALQTSPLVSPAMAPKDAPLEPPDTPGLQEPDFLDLATEERKPLPDGKLRPRSGVLSVDRRAHSEIGSLTPLSMPFDDGNPRPVSGDWSGTSLPEPAHLDRSVSDGIIPPQARLRSNTFSNPQRPTLLTQSAHVSMTDAQLGLAPPHERPTSPPPVPTQEAVDRAKSLSKKLSGSNIPTRISESGDLMLDMTGYKSSEDEALRAEVIARKILSEELEGNYDIGALIGADERGNLWIYSSEEAKEAAGRRATESGLTSDAVSDPGYHSDGEASTTSTEVGPTHFRRGSDPPANGLVTPPQTPPDSAVTAGDPNRNYAKTLRLTSDQIKALGLRPGANSMSFSVNRATCTAYMYYWTHDVPIVISDIDGTITKSDALGHVLNMIGRDWTHLGVAKLYTDIVANGYNIMYLTSRSVGQADTTRSYLKNVVQDTHRLPKGPVIMSPDRTVAALRREIYLRKPEVFKMACLRDILNLFQGKTNPFYAGFGNRLTDALSYRSVNIPSTRIFTINTNAEVSLDLLTLNKYKSSYVTMREIVDHFFPPVGLLVTGGGEEFTDFNYWRDRPLALDDFSASDSETSDSGSVRSEDEGSEGLEDEEGRHLEDSYISRESYDDEGDVASSILEYEDRLASSMMEGRGDTEDEAGEEVALPIDPVDDEVEPPRASEEITHPVDPADDGDLEASASANGNEQQDEKQASSKVLISRGMSGSGVRPVQAIRAVTAGIKNLTTSPAGKAAEVEADLGAIRSEQKADPSVKENLKQAP